MKLLFSSAVPALETKYRFQLYMYKRIFSVNLICEIESVFKNFCSARQTIGSHYY